MTSRKRGTKKNLFKKFLKTVKKETNLFSSLLKEDRRKLWKGYKSFIKRKGKERKFPEKHKIKHYPTAKEIKKRPEPLNKLKGKIKSYGKKEKPVNEWLKTGVPGFDELFEKGIPKGSSILISGGAGSGKTIFLLQTLNYAAINREKCLYISFEESEKSLKKHMRDFGWDPDDLEKKGLLKIKRVNTFDISTSVEALLAKAKGDLMIELKEVPGLFPPGFKPDRVAIDSLTALAASFTKREETYRIYVEQLFRHFEKMGVTSFLISETEQLPTKFSETGVEEFLADGVIVLYNVKRENIRENAIEVLKMRGVKHQKKIVAFQITNKGIVVYPEQELFGGLEEKV